MKLEIELSDELIEKVVCGIMDNFPEASSGSALVCTNWRYFDHPQGARFIFDDGETGATYILDKSKLLQAFPLIFTEKWPKGCTQPPFSNNWETWEEWLCQADATDFDAYVQLACFGEVIYG